MTAITGAMPEGRGRVVVVGGGLAGLAAAVALAERQVAVTLVEARPCLGGRASSFWDSQSQAWTDNCQHVSMGCCVNLADFSRRVGLEDLFQREATLYFQDESGRISRFVPARLPAPLHLLPAFARAGFLTLGDKLRVALGMWRLLREPTAPTGFSFEDWLRRRGQNQRVRQRYWGLILASALNETLENIDYRYARQVFLEGFLASRAAGEVFLPKVALGELYGERLLAWLTRHDVAVRLNQAAVGLEFEAGAIAGCRLKDGTKLLADHYLLAVPFQRVGALVPAEAAELRLLLAQLAQIDSSPITSVHFWFDRPVMPTPHLVPVGRTVQWLFRRSADESAIDAPNGHYVQAVISAARSLVGMGNEGIGRLVEEEVRRILPQAAGAKVLHARVVTERAATFSIRPGVDVLRPGQRTPIPNLWLAGDYTQTGWPATMEGAARSGYLAAEGILGDLGQVVSLVRPGLAWGWLATWLARIPPPPVRAPMGEVVVCLPPGAPL